MIDGKYKVKIIDLQDKYRFKIFCGYDDAGIKQDIEELQDEIDTINTNLALYSLITQTGYSVELELNNTNYQLSAKVKNKNGTVLSTSNIIDLPIESMIVDGSYDSTTKSLVLILQNGNTITVPLADIISGLVDEETFENAIEEVNTTIDNLDTRIEEEQSLQDQEIENLKTLRNILPKVSGTGESITLDNTGETSLYDIDLYGNTSQVSTTGKNILGLTDGTYTRDGITCIVKDGVITASGTATANAIVNIPMKNQLILNGTYTLSAFNSVANSNTQVRLDGDGDTYVILATANISKTFTKETTTYANLVFRTNNGITLTNYVIKPMLESGSTATSYEPYTNGASPNPDYPQPIHSVSGDNTINIVGKNIANIYLKNYKIGDKVTINGITYEFLQNRKIHLSGTATATSHLSFFGKWNDLVPNEYIKLDKTKSYIITSNGTNTPSGDKARPYARIARVNDDGTTSVATANIGVAFTNYDYINSLQLTTASGVTINEDIWLQIEENTTATDFEAFNGDTYPINLPVENLFDEANITFEQGTISNTGSESSSPTTMRMVDYMEIKPGNYVASYTAQYGTFINIVACYDSSKTFIERLTGLDNNKFTIPSTTKYIRLCFNTTQVSPISRDYFSNIQIEKGSKANSFTPYGTTPLELNGIGDYKDTFKLSDESQLFDKDNIQWDRDNSSNFNIGTSGTNTIRIRTSSFAIQGGKTYTISGMPNGISLIAIRTYNVPSGDSIGSATLSGNSFTLADNVNYIHILFGGTNFTDATKTLMENANIMLNKGSTAMGWQPYGKDKWYLEKNTNSIVLDGSETYTGVWWDSSVPRIGARIDLHNALYPSSSDVYEEILSDKYKSYAQVRLYLAPSSSNYVETGICIRANNSQLIIKNNNLTLASDTEQGAAQAIKGLVTTNGLKIVYPLATPTGIEITDTTLISQLNAIKNAMSKKGQTNISQVNNDLPFELDVIAFKDMSNL